MRWIYFLEKSLIYIEYQRGGSGLIVSPPQLTSMPVGTSINKYTAEINLFIV